MLGICQGPGQGFVRDLSRVLESQIQEGRPGHEALGSQEKRGSGGFFEQKQESALVQVWLGWSWPV